MKQSTRLAANQLRMAISVGKALEKAEFASANYTIARRSKQLKRGQKRTLMPSCAWRGSPKPERTVPSKLNRSGRGTEIRFVLLNRLKTSNSGSICTFSAILKTRVTRKSNE